MVIESLLAEKQYRERNSRSKIKGISKQYARNIVSWLKTYKTSFVLSPGLLTQTCAPRFLKEWVCPPLCPPKKKNTASGVPFLWRC